jgi:hypothetical protein
MPDCSRHVSACGGFPPRCTGSPPIVTSGDLDVGSVEAWTIAAWTAASAVGAILFLNVVADQAARVNQALGAVERRRSRQAKRRAAASQAAAATEEIITAESASARGLSPQR